MANCIDQYARPIAVAYYNSRVDEFLEENKNFKRNEMGLPGMFEATFPGEKKVKLVIVTIRDRVCDVSFGRPGEKLVVRTFQVGEL